MLRNALFMYLGVGCLLDAWMIREGMYEDLSEEIIPKYGDNLKTRFTIACIHLGTILAGPVMFVKHLIEEGKHGN